MAGLSMRVLNRDREREIFSLDRKTSCLEQEADRGKTNKSGCEFRQFNSLTLNIKFICLQNLHNNISML